MSTKGERNWSAVISIATEHAGLKPHFAQLEDRLYACLSEIDDPRRVRDFLVKLRSHLTRERTVLRIERTIGGRASRSAPGSRKRRS